MRRQRGFITFLVITLLAIAGVVSIFLLRNTSSSLANRSIEGQDVITDSYIVVLKEDVADPESIANEIAKIHGLAPPKHIYTNAIKGYSATIPQDKLDKVKKDPRVAFVSLDRIVGIFPHKPGHNPLGKSTPTPTPPPQPPQSTPTGVSRIGINSANKGTGIGIAVIDTGIDLSHPDLSANIVANKTCVTGTSSGNDDNGHGTHVAGTIAAVNNTIGVVGVSPEAKLIAVKVLSSSGSGSWSGVICGVDWVTANAIKYNIKVANMSLGGSGSSDNNCGNTNNDALHKAICNSTAAGITYVVAAGNSSPAPSPIGTPVTESNKVGATGVDASGVVPAAYDDTVITVSALADSDGQPGGLGTLTSYGADDTFATFSNYGSMVDLGGPGVSIYSTWKGGGYNYSSGTSMASPHVAASVALYIKSNPGVIWSQVRDALKTQGEPLGSGHSDPSGFHPEPVVRSQGL